MQQTNPDSRKSSPDDIDRAEVIEENQPEKFVSPRDERKLAAQVFDNWLTYQNRKKQAWERMIRHNFQKDMKQKKECFHAWLCFLKTKKILRLQYTLCSHNNYKHQVRFVFGILKAEWRQGKSVKSGLLKIAQMHQEILVRRMFHACREQVSEDRRVAYYREQLVFK